MASSLSKLMKHGAAKLADLSLTTNQFNNFQKMQHWGLIEKDFPSGWRITKAGIDFVKNKIEIPDWVQTYRNKVTAG